MSRPAVGRGPVQDRSERLNELRAEKLRRVRAKLNTAWAEKALRFRAHGSFEAFVKLAWPIVEPKELVWAPYLSVLCHALHRQMLGDPEYRYLLLCVPPGFAKSLLVSVMAPAFEWLHVPSRRKLFFSAGDRVAIRDSRRTRRLIQDPLYLDLVARACKARGEPVWELCNDQNQKANFENSAQGFRQCLTMESGITGSRGDDLVVDDPIDVQEVLFGATDTIERRMRETQARLDQVIETRVNDRRSDRRTLIMQRLHELDPAGAAIREGGWHVIVLPLRYDPKHPQVCPDDPRKVEGELLHPEFMPEAEAQKLERKLGEWQASAQLQQVAHAATGGQIRREWFRRYYLCTPEDMAATCDEVWISSDAAKKGTATADFHAIHVWGFKGNDRILLDRVTERMGYPEYERTMDGMHSKWAKWRTGTLIEDTANGTTYMQVHGSTLHTLVPFSPTGDTPGKDSSKAARAVYFERAAESDAIVLPDPRSCAWVLDVVTWWCAFGPGCAHDDDMDAASQINMRRTLEMNKTDGEFAYFAAGPPTSKAASVPGYRGMLAATSGVPT